MKNIMRRFLSVMMIMVLIASMGLCVYGSSLSEAEAKKSELEKELSKAEQLMDSLYQSQEQTEDKISELTATLTDISSQITELQNQLTEKNIQISSSQEKVAAAKQNVDSQYQDMKLRIQFMYENGQRNWLEYFLSAGSLSELLNITEYISNTMNYDRERIKDYEKAVDDLSQAESGLEQERSELEELKANVERDKQQIQALLDKKEQELSSLSYDLGDAKQQAEVYEAEIQAQEEVLSIIRAAEAERLAKEEAERIAREEADRKAQEEADRKAQEEANKNQTSEDASDQDSSDNQVSDNSDSDSSNDSGSSGGSGNSGSSAGSGGSGDSGGGSSNVTSSLTWPVPSSRRITSGFGMRDAPTAGATTNHNGIDIGASYGADVVAAASGTVINAFKSATGGNMIIINHGNGMYTVYMHNSSLLVSSGDKVSAGQVIAKIGSTGISTGNHLHFGVSINGTYVNPMNYF